MLVTVDGATVVARACARALRATVLLVALLAGVFVPLRTTVLFDAARGDVVWPLADVTAVRAIVAARDVPPDMAFVLDVEFVAEFLVTVFVDSRVVVVVGRLLTVGDVMRPVRAITVDAFSDAD